MLKSSPPMSTGYQGTARPSCAHQGIKPVYKGTARRGGHSLSRTSRQSRVSKEKPAAELGSGPGPRILEKEGKERCLEHEKGVGIDKMDVEGDLTWDMTFSPRSLAARTRTIEKENMDVTASTNSLPAPSPSIEQTLTPSEIQVPISTILSDVDPTRARQQQQRQTPIPSRSKPIDPICKAMARSIIAGFPRKALEELLLSAAMGNTGVMDKVIEWNMKHSVQEAGTTEANDECPAAIATRQPNQNHSSLHVIEYNPPQTVLKTKAAPPHKAPNLEPKLIDDDDDDNRLSITRPAISINTAAQETPTAQKTALALQTAKRRREHNEKHEAPSTSPKRPKQSFPIPTPPQRVTKLSQPLSSLTAKWTYMPLIDIETYVNRPIAVRHAEGKRERERERAEVSGNIKAKRPMNSFMLYRKAFQNRAKEYGFAFMVNPPVVSQICAESWALEPEEVKARFVTWAGVERDMHEVAHPGYKVCDVNVDVKAGRGVGGGVKVNVI